MTFLVGLARVAFATAFFSDSSSASSFSCFSSFPREMRSWMEGLAKDMFRMRLTSSLGKLVVEKRKPFLWALEVKVKALLASSSSKESSEYTERVEFEEGVTWRDGSEFVEAGRHFFVDVFH